MTALVYGSLFTGIGGFDLGTAGQSDSARYRQLGNAVAVPVAEWLGRQMLNLF